MARFFSKHEMAKYDKKLSEENYLNTDRFREQLRVEISKDNHRVNIDSAKKKAVLQGMNYDGFHQMVLGADLKGIKQGEIINISNNNTILNNVNTQNKLQNPLEILKNSFVSLEKEDSRNEKILKNLFDLKIEDQELLNEVNTIKYNQKDFVKEWKLINVNHTNQIINIPDNANKKDNKIDVEINKNLEQKFLLMKLFSLQEFKEILEQEKITSDVFLELLNSIGELSIIYTLKKNFDVVKELINFLNIIVNSKFYSSLKIFIGKKQKNFYSDLKKEIGKEDNREHINNNYAEQIDVDEIISFIEKNF